MVPPESIMTYSELGESHLLWIECYHIYSMKLKDMCCKYAVGVIVLVWENERCVTLTSLESKPWDLWKES
jgi:hypothetical protein